MLNFSLMKEPLNWVIVTLMVIVGSLAFHYISISVADNGSATS